MFDLVDVLDQFDRTFGFGDADLVLAPSTKGNVKYTIPSFPPAKVTQDVKDGTLKFVFHLAGYKKEDLKISFDKEFLVLAGKPENVENVENEKVLANTLKGGSFSYKYFVPKSKFDRKSTVADFKDGVLEISVKVNKETEEEMKPIEIN